jgi:hypothetical protein
MEPRAFLEHARMKSLGTEALGFLEWHLRRPLRSEEANCAPLMFDGCSNQSGAMRPCDVTHTVAIDRWIATASRRAR